MGFAPACFEFEHADIRHRHNADAVNNKIFLDDFKFIYLSLELNRRSLSQILSLPKGFVSNFGSGQSPTEGDQPIEQ